MLERVAALAIIPEVVQRTAAYRAFDAALASPRRLGGALGASGLAVIAGPSEDPDALVRGRVPVLAVADAVWAVVREQLLS